MICNGTQLIELSGEATPEMMGRSFYRRRVSAAARVARKTTRAAAPLVRKISHTAFNVGAKIPGYGLAVTAARGAQSSFASKARSALQMPGGPMYNAPSAPEYTPRAPGAPAAEDNTAPGAGMSTGKKIAIGAGVVAAVGVAIVVAKKVF